MLGLRNALVVGGGIGGMTAAIAMRRQGINVDLVELSKAWTVYGVGIIQPNNTLRALEKIGLAKACVEHGGAFPGWQIRDKDGNKLFEAPSTSLAAPQYPPNNGIRRPVLHRLLQDALMAENVQCRLGISVQVLEQTEDYVAVTFSDGRAGRYDLVVGADGIGSSIRRLIYGDLYQPRFTGQGAWRYNLPRPPSVQWGHLYYGPGTKVGLVPLAPNLMYLFLVTAETGRERMDPTQLTTIMRQRMVGYTGLVAELRDMITDPDEVVYRPMENTLVPPPWGKGRVILIGDAAHATTPHLSQGAAMAVEDGVLLAELVARDMPLAASLDEFVARRYPRSKFVVDSSLQIAEWEMEEWRGVQNPDANPGLLLHTATQRLMEAF